MRKLFAGHDDDFSDDGSMPMRPGEGDEFRHADAASPGSRCARLSMANKSNIDGN